MPFSIGPVMTRTGVPAASLIVSRIAGASSAASARSCSGVGYVIGCPAFSAAASASVRFCFSVLRPSFRRYVNTAPYGGFGAVKSISP